MSGSSLPLPPLLLAQLACALLFAILFLQSGLDKVFDWKGNLAWLTGHFAKSPLGKLVPVLLLTLTVLELAAGLASAAGACLLLFTGRGAVAQWGMVLSLASLLALFFGQRMAKDYAGAGSLVPYFAVAVGGLLLLGF